MTTTDSASAGVTGINTDKVPDWLAANISGLRAPFSFELIAGGRSNMTFGVTDAAGRKVVLRRPPMSHVLASAHDMGREHRIISALADTPVPVPRTLGYCEDESVNERPFYVMDFVDGLILRTKDETAARFDEAARRGIGENLVDVLAAIHDVDVDAVGLGTLARKEGYIARQLKRWYSQYGQSKEMGAPDVADIDKVHDLLTERIPDQVGTAIVHGDYRLDNCIVGDDGVVRAVLDWELCTLGDALADVGLLMVYWAEPDDETTALMEAATTIPGFASRAELCDRYAQASGRDLSDLDFYVAFGYWKLACVLEGVFARYAGGAGGGDQSDYRGFADQVIRLAASAAQIAGGL
jgi:aminoglycoside phosphotransferase (APT) family kinase protein